MRKLIFLIVVQLLIALNARSQDFSGADFREDLNNFKKTLPERHTNLFSKLSKVNFERKIDSIAQHAETLSYNSFLAALFNITVAIDDEHTRIEPVFKKQFPIKFKEFKEGIFVTDIDSSNSIALPAKLIAINNHTVATIIDRFKQIVQGKNSSYFKVNLLNYLNNPAVLNGLGLTPDENESILILRDRKGKTISVTLKSIPKSQRINLIETETAVPMLASQKHDNYWFRFDEDKQFIYFNYSKCAEQQNLSFSRFNDSLFSFIEKHQPNKLIVDLRFNSGGNSAILEPFITAIEKSYLNRPGKLLVLIGERTFSSALMNAVELKRQTKATLIGSPTSGNINHYGEVRGFALPRTKLTIGYSTKYWETWKGKNGPLIPDVRITYSVFNFMKGIDEALAYSTK